MQFIAYLSNATIQKKRSNRKVKMPWVSEQYCGGKGRKDLDKEVNILKVHYSINLFKM